MAKRKLKSYPLRYEWKQDWPELPKLKPTKLDKRGRPIKTFEPKDFEHTGTILADVGEAKK